MNNRPRQASAPPRRRRRRLRIALWIGCCILAAFFSFGLSPHDTAAVSAFVDSARRWQVNPEFRAIAIDYSERGSAAMRIHPAFVPARRIILAIRSIPGLPKSFAVNPTSEAHYREFSSGPLCAYLHLCDEQDVPDYLPLIEAVARKKSADDADYLGFLDTFKMDFGVTRDAGALRSVAALVQDARAAQTFTIRTNVTELLRPPAAAVARQLGLPTDPHQMTANQQREVLERLDDYVHDHDPELWRTKQVSDFCGGVWAQVFSPPYDDLLVPALDLQLIGRLALAALLLGMCLRQAARLRAATTPADAQRDPDDSLALAPVGPGAGQGGQSDERR